MIKKLFFMILGSLLILSACSNNDEKDKDTNDQKSESHMKHNDESKVPEDMKSTNEGEFKVGDKVTITAGHMPGMKGAEATVKGATANIDNVKKTTVYVVDYKSKDNGKIIKNHKWMTGNELKAR
ncbi:TPA: YdhK family protein [Staphylococcus aureus]